MALSPKYNPSEVEDKWYQEWMDKGYFKSSPNPDKEPYTIVIPPPNVTGVLHMGHMLNNTIQDVLIRRARMLGKEALWVPGTDHASIATEAKVVAMLREQGIKKSDISREEFLEYAWEWREKYGGIILEQLKKLGASCDWDRTKFTMDDDMSEAVIKIFVDLFKKGHIYRGYRMVNWDPEGKTALADDEVFHKEISSKLYFVKYRIDGEDGEVTIATTRPETILGDTAICINPKDERYQHLKGRRALVPLINRSIPIIEDDYVEMEFGTGCLKVTPAHDVNDYDLGKKHNLESIDILNPDASLNENAQLFIGEDRFVARKSIVKELEKNDHIHKIEDYTNKVGYSERTNAVVEPRLSLQWYVRMEQLTKPALQNVENNEIQLVPSKFKNMYRHWMENVRDWCISRQLWWGQRIPAYYLTTDDREDPNIQVFVGETPEEALADAKEKTGNDNLELKDLIQDDDVLDTWFSSGLWPITVFDGIRNPDNEEINYYYPTNDLITAPEILFFWVARMIMYGYEYRDQKPFQNVYLTGIVRDKQGRKMSKSLGNSPDPLELMKQYGADGVRTGMLFSSPAGNDLLFDEKLCEQGRNFNNKIWNAFRLIKGWKIEEGKATSEANEIAIKWFESRLGQALEEINDHFTKFRISDALKVSYSLVWSDYCAWYLEMIKPGYEEPIDATTYEKTIEFLEDLLRLLHPFMPFISEEIWQNLKDRKAGDHLIINQWPEEKPVNKKILSSAELSFELISQIRNFRAAKNLSPKTALDLELIGDRSKYQDFEQIVSKLGNINDFKEVDEKTSGAGFLVKEDEFNIPLEGTIDLSKEKESMTKELERLKGFAAGLNKKLSNAGFTSNAPPNVVDLERKKLEDAESKIRTLQDSLGSI